MILQWSETMSNDEINCVENIAPATWLSSQW